MTTPPPTVTPPPDEVAGGTAVPGEVLPQPAAGTTRGRGRASFSEILVSFENRDFRYLCLSTLSLGVGQWAQQIGLPWLAFQLSGSASSIGVVSALQGGIGIVTAPMAGYLADRFPRRKVLMWSTMASAIQAAVLAVLVLAGMITMPLLYVLALAGGVLQSMAQPARQSFVYDVSTDETLVNAVAMNSIVQNFARIAAPPLAGALIGFWGTGAAFLVLAATRVIAVIFTQMIGTTTRQRMMTTRRNPAAEMWAGFTATWQDRRVLGLVVVHTIPTLLIIPYLPFLSVLARDVYHGDARSFALLTSMVGWGAVVGLFVLALLKDPKRKGLLMLVCFTAYAGFVFAVFTVHAFVLAMAMLVMVGVVNSVAFALNNTLIQIAAPNEARGRVMSVWQLTSGFQPLGALPMGFMIDRFGIANGMGGFMVVAVIAFIAFTAFWPSVRRM